MLKAFFSSPNKKPPSGGGEASNANAMTTPMSKYAAESNSTPPFYKSPSETVSIKMALVGDTQAGKTCLAKRFSEDTFAEQYHPTFTVNVSERRIRLGGDRDVIFSLWDLGGGKNQVDEMLPMACVDATVIVFVFDLARLESLEDVKELYRKVRTHNSMARAVLVGAKFDLFVDLDPEDQERICTLSRRYALAMKSPLIFTSAAYAINVQKLFKIVSGLCFQVDVKVEKISKVGEPLIEY